MPARKVQELLAFPDEVKWGESHSVVSNSLRPDGLCSPWDSPGQYTEVGSLSLLRGIFPAQGSNPGLLHCRQILYQLNHSGWGKPFLINWHIRIKTGTHILQSESESHSVVSNSLQPHRLYSPWNFPGQDTGVASVSLLQRIFPTQESNWGLLYCRQILYQLSYQGSPVSCKVPAKFLKEYAKAVMIGSVQYQLLLSLWWQYWKLDKGPSGLLWTLTLVRMNIPLI